MFLFSLIAFFHTNRTFIETELSAFPKKQTLSLLPSQWYYVYLNSIQDIKKIQSKLPNLKISPLEFNGDFLTLFLNPNEVRSINSIPSINIYTKKPKRVSFSSTTKKNETYIVYAHSSFSAPIYSKTISRTGPYYFISTNQPTMIENDPSVLLIKKVPNFHTMNRWTAGFIQSGDQNPIIKNGFYTTNRKYNDRGLNGSNVIVTLIDSGTEVNNCLFNDPKYPTPFNETNLNHRKIIRYDPFADRTDLVIGHGTHCAGIIAGQTDSPAMSLYDGHAPAAKLYVADIGYDADQSIDASFTFDIFQQAKKLNSPIISCSWGDEKTTEEFTEMFDYLSYENPSQLFVFAAGNDYYTYKIGTPANSKNVLTIASANPPRSYYLSDSTHIVKLVSGNDFINVISANVLLALGKHDVSYLNDIELITYEQNRQVSDYSNKAVLINREKLGSLNYRSAFDVLAANNARAAIIFDDYRAENDNIIIITTSTLNKAFFDTHNKFSITIEIPANAQTLTTAPYSSKGPSLYGNRKPDIMAPGTYILSASNSRNSNECNFKSSLTEMSGTSMATPAVSGSLALVYQYLTERIHGLPFDKTKVITSALLRAFAIAASGDKEDNVQGFGNINLSRILVYPNLDHGFGLRFYSDKISHTQFISFFVKTDHVGPLSVSLSWIDLPINLKSLNPLFAYFEFYIIGPDRSVHDCEEQFSTNKKIVINDAKVGTYEIRLRMNTVIPSEYQIDYSLVIVGPFDQLNFINNPSELTPTTPRSCALKCPSNKCDSNAATCVCDKLHTGTNCEFEVTEIHENQAISHQMNNREFFYTHLDLSKYKNMKESELKNLVFTLTVKDKKGYYNNGIIRYFFNTDNELPLYIPRYFIQLQGQLQTVLQYPMSEMAQLDDIYLTVFNDYGVDIDFSLNWTVRHSSIYTKSGAGDLSSAENSTKFTKTRTFKVIMLSLIVVGCVAIVSTLVFLIVRTVNKKNKKHGNNNYQTYTESNDQANNALIDNE